MNEYEDTYFFSRDEALKVATRQNRFDNDEKLQVCYYDGEKIESNLVNLIHLPVDNLLEELAMGRFRLPTKVDLNGLELSSSVKIEITTHFNMSLFQVREYRNQYNQSYLKTSQNATLDFNEPLRFYLSANSETQVMQYVSKAIAQTLQDAGYEVFYDLYYGVEDRNCLKNISAFNPHATININHFNNAYISHECFNFVWFQDPMAILYDASVLLPRERDYVFSLLKEFDLPLLKKGVTPKRQGFCINKKDFKLHAEIERKKKIVFVGSSYAHIIPQDKDVADAIEYSTKAFGDGEYFGEEFVDEVSTRFFLNKDFVLTKLLPFIVRDISVLWLCGIESEYEIEIYGHGWELYDSVKPFYKGPLAYGEEISKVYSGATYSFAPHQNYVLQQRVLEASACGCASIVYNPLEPNEPKIYEESLEYYKTKQDLLDILNATNAKEKSFDRLLSENSYEHFAQEILETIKKVTHER